MKIIFIDSTALPNTPRGPGSPAYFSRFLIQHLSNLGHTVVIHPLFDAGACSDADLVICEWCNEQAYVAAQQGCKRLVIRMRGYEVFGPLDQLKWENVDALVYESPLLKETAETRCAQLVGFRSHVIPSGVDLANIPFHDHAEDTLGGDVVALVARTTSDKGYQLAYEWARRHPDKELHITGALGQTNPRLIEYLNYAKPANVTVHGTVNTVEWLDEIGAQFLLSASIYESLGYVIAEAMAMGIKPLIHDAPGITKFWPVHLTWRSLDDLDRLVAGPYDSQSYRDFVAARLDAAKLSTEFADLVLSLPARDTSAPTEAIRRYSYDYANRVFKVLRRAIEQPSDMAAIDELVTDYRSRIPPHSRGSSERYGAAMATAVAYYNHENYEMAELWSCRAMLDFARPDAMCLLGEIADARGDEEEAAQWYRAACAVEDVPDRYRFPEIVEKRFARLDDMERKLEVILPPGEAPARYVVIVCVRNGEKWINRCLQSVQSQMLRNWICVVVDDVSTDRTALIADAFRAADDRFVVHRNTERFWQARNMVEGARTYATDPEDVVVYVDGDDYLLDEHAFEDIDTAYRRGAWMTYGCLVNSEGAPTRFGKYPRRIAAEGRFTDWVWCATPPRTFKRFLLDELKDEDFMLEGRWPEMAGDVCVFTPLMELACERVVAITRPIYVYNTDTPDNEHKVAPYEQLRQRDMLWDRVRKKRLER